MADVSLDIDKLLESPQARVQLSHGSRQRPWVSWMRSDMSVSVSADYDAPFESMLEGLTASVGKADILTQGGLAEWAESIGTKIDTARTPAAFANTWTSSERPVFSADLVFLSTKSIDRPQDEAIALAAMCLPGITSGAAPTFTRPAGYRAGAVSGRYGERSPPGTFTLSLGNWFSAPGLILTQAEVTLSQQRMANGQPLYAEVSATLEPWRMISDEEFTQFFIIGPARAGVSR